MKTNLSLQSTNSQSAAAHSKPSTTQNICRAALYAIPLAIAAIAIGAAIGSSWTSQTVSMSNQVTSQDPSSPTVLATTAATAFLEAAAKNFSLGNQTTISEPPTQPEIITEGIIYQECGSSAVNRGALDVGSGSIKVTLAKVDPQTQKICETFYSEELSLPLKRDIQVGGKSELSEKIQRTAIDTLSQLKGNLTSYEPTDWKGVATAASRQAKNAQQLYQRIHNELGMDISIISQEEEGRLGFATAAAVSGIDQDKLIAVDSGSGSFQLATLLDGNMEVIEGHLGYIPSLEVLMEIRGEKLDMQTPPSQVRLEEVKPLIERLQTKMPPMTEEFLQKLQAPSSKVVGIGNENFIFGMSATAVGKPTFTKEELMQAIKAHAGKTAEEMKQFAHPNTTVLGMTLLYSIMDSMGINQLSSYSSNGSCEGLLADASYWPRQS